MIRSSFPAAIFWRKLEQFLWFHLLLASDDLDYFLLCGTSWMIHFGSSVNCCETTADSSFPSRGDSAASRDARDTQNQIWLQIILCFIKFIAFWFSHAVFICFPGDKINFEAHNAAKFVFFCLRLETFLNVIYVPVHVDFFAWCLLKKKNFFRCRLTVEK